MILFINELLTNPIYSSIIVFISQILFIYLRTINIIYTNDRRMIASTITGVGIGLTYLISMSIGLNSLLNGNLITVFIFLLGGAIGNVWGIYQEKRKDKKE